MIYLKTLKFKDTEKQLDELIQRTDKQLKDFLEK